MRINVNPFIPKLNTPYQNEVKFYFSENIKELRLKLQIIEKELKKIPSVKLKFKKIKEIINNARIQTIISVGGMSFGKLLLEYYLNGATYGAFKKAERNLNISIDDYLLKVQEGNIPWNPL